MPEFGELQATEVWEAATRTLTDLSLEEIADLPIFDSTYGVLLVTSSAVAGSFGSWTELIADVGAGKRLLYIVHVNITNLGAIEVELGSGTAGNEVVIGRYNLGAMRSSQTAVVSLFLALADNIRLSARVKDDGGASSHYLGVNMA